MNDSSTFSLDDTGFARVTGPLTLDTVNRVFQQAESAGGSGRHIAELDLSEVSHVDSSGLALLLEWQFMATRDNRPFQIRNAPADLLSLASLCEASDLLAINGRDLSPDAQPGPASSQQVENT